VEKRVNYLPNGYSLIINKTNKFYVKGTLYSGFSPLGTFLVLLIKGTKGTPVSNLNKASFP